MVTVVVIEDRQYLDKITPHDSKYPSLDTQYFLRSSQGLCFLGVYSCKIIPR